MYKFVKDTNFGEIELTEIRILLRSQIEKLKKDKPSISYDKPLTENIRETLKEMMQKEIEVLPNTLKELEPVQRLNILCKLIPYVLPKVESVIHTQGEPDTYNE